MTLRRVQFLRSAVRGLKLPEAKSDVHETPEGWIFLLFVFWKMTEERFLAGVEPLVLFFAGHMLDVKLLFYILLLLFTD